MIYTEFDPLQTVIVGDCYAPGDLDYFLPKDSTSSFNRILEETKQDLENLSNFLKKSNIEVLRPRVIKFNHNIEMPEFNVRLPICPIVPRDQYLVLDRTIIQTYTSYTDRYFDSLSYYDIFLSLFKEGYNWLSQPLPMIKNLGAHEHWYTNKKIYTEKLPNRVLWHTATMFKAGDSIIYNHNGPGSDLGLEWIKKNLSDYKFIPNTDTIFENYGHIDHGFLLIDDDTVIHAGIEWVPNCLRNKKLIDVKAYLPQVNLENFLNDYTATEGRYSQSWLEKYLLNWRGYAQEVCFDLNVLILDSKNIIFGRELPELFQYLKTHGIECHLVPQRHGLYWEGGVHCSTLDIKRKGIKRSIIQ
jgi:N-dimethylarginine dimethylaminohydrolase